MTLRSRRFSPTHRIKASQWAIALALGASMGATAHAATVGHSRVISAPGAPLQIVVPLDNVTAEELASLKVSLADAAAWQRAGLQPPVPLNTARVSVQDGPRTTGKNIRIESSQPLATSAVDLLLDLQSSSGHRQVQVTILVPQRAAAAPVQSARTGSVSADRAAPASAETVRAGDNLFRIARRNGVSDASVYQMLVAIWRANPQAFIQNNMNLVRAGETLTIPDAATVRAIDPAEARRIYVEQAEAFARYRGRAGAAVAGAAAVGEGANAGGGRVSEASPSGGSAAATSQDRLRLSSSDAAGAQADAQADARTSEQHALQDAQQRVETLQGNVDALSQAAGSGTAGSDANQNNAAGGSGVAGADGTAGAAAGNAGGGAAGAGTGTTGSGAAGAGAGVAGATGDANTAGANTGGAAAGGGGTGATGSTAGGAGAAGAGTSGSNATGASNAAGTEAAGTEAAAQDLAAASGANSAGSTSTTGNWLTDNLLVVVTSILALIVLIIAWLLRRAGARRADENEDEDASYGGEPVLDASLLTRKLDGIDLDLNKPPTDEPRARGPRV
ncbi:LysM domain-containing protein [Bordetella tumbae]|uniref:type IV pilus assembly protein FimV n=1 Tax=Bordetella tumbae TaxID=1649139 RepID=UPI0039EFD976